MKKSGIKLFVLGFFIELVFVIWTVLVQFVDVKAVGQNGTTIGFSSFNSWFHGLTGVSMTLYTITDWLGILPIVVCFGFAFLLFLTKVFLVIEQYKLTTRVLSMCHQ